MMTKTSKFFLSFIFWNSQSDLINYTISRIKNITYEANWKIDVIQSKAQAEPSKAWDPDKQIMAKSQGASK